MIATALKQMGYDPLSDFVCQDDGEGPYLKTWLSKDKPQPDAKNLAAMVDALEQGVVTPSIKKSDKERLVELEALVAQQAAKLEEIENKTGTLEAKWSAE